VDGRIVPLTYILKSGEQIEILTTKETAPNRNWIDTNLGYLKSQRSIQKVKNWFRQQEELENAKAQADSKVESPPTVVETAKEVPLINSVRANKSLHACEVSVEGLNNVQTTFAQCCHPVAGDEITGYISHYKGIIVHRADCKNMLQLSLAKQPQRIAVAWQNSKASHAVPIVIHAFNAQNLLTDVSQLLAQNKIHIFSAALEADVDFSAVLNLTLQIENTQQLNTVIKKIKQLPAIVNAQRKN
jgi:GTP pyrophosphokinase